MPSVEWIILYSLLGAFTGFMAGLLGVGGGGILVPLLTSIFIYQGMAINSVVHLALGTSLACMIISATASLRSHAKKGNILWRMFYGIAPGIIVGSFLTSHLAAKLDSTYIALFFACFMAFVAITMFLNWQLKKSTTESRFSRLLLVGAGIGSISALAAVGGGFLAITYLTYKNAPMKKAVGTSSAMGFPIAIAGTIGYLMSGWSKTQSEPYAFGFIYMPAFLAISASSYFTAPYGARYANTLPDAHLKKIFAIVSLILSFKMLFSVL